MPLVCTNSNVVIFLMTLQQIIGFDRNSNYRKLPNYLKKKTGMLKIGTEVHLFTLGKLLI